LAAFYLAAWAVMASVTLPCAFDHDTDARQAFPALGIGYPPGNGRLVSVTRVILNIGQDKKLTLNGFGLLLLRNICPLNSSYLIFRGNKILSGTDDNTSFCAVTLTG